MRVALDIDGVLYHWSRTARYMLRTYRGLDIQGEAQSWDWNVTEGVSKADWHWLWTEGIDLGLFRYGHVMKDAIVGVRQLQDLGLSLIVVTHRPARAVKDTIAWLNYVNFPLDGVHILTGGQPKTSVEWDLLVDDKPTNVEHALGKARMGLLFDQPWNQSARYMRAYGWLGYDGVVKNIERITRRG